MTRRRSRTPQAAWPQAVAVLVGILFTILGVIGFAASGLDGFAAHGVPSRLFGLAVNPLQNLLHLALGAAGIVLSGRLPRARVYGWVLAIGLGALFGYGVLVSRVPSWDVLNLNWATNWLHLVFALVGFLIAVGPARVRQRSDAAAAATAQADSDSDVQTVQ